MIFVIGVQGYKEQMLARFLVSFGCQMFDQVFGRIFEPVFGQDLGTENAVYSSTVTKKSAALAFRQFFSLFLIVFSLFFLSCSWLLLLFLGFYSFCYLISMNLCLFRRRKASAVSVQFVLARKIQEHPGSGYALQTIFRPTLRILQLPFKQKLRFNRFPLV